MDKQTIPDSELKRIAEYILYSQVEEVEFLTACEVTDDQLDDNPDYLNLSQEDKHELALKIHDLCYKAKVTITFED